MSPDCIGYYSPLAIGGTVPEPPPPGQDAPVNLTAPYIYGMEDPGLVQPGETVSVTNGTWSGSPTITFTYQWYLGASLIVGATNASYTVLAADAESGDDLSCVVTATNGAGSDTASTADVAIIEADALAWIEAEEAAGATFNASQKSAISVFYATQKASGVWAKMRFLYPTWFGAEARNAIDMVEQRIALFPNGMSHSAGYIQGTGANQYMDTQYAITGANPITNLCTMGVLCLQAQTSDVPNRGTIMMTNNNPTTDTIALAHGSAVSGPTFTRTGNASAVDGGLTPANQTGFLIGSQTGNGSDTFLAARRNTAGYTLLNDISANNVTSSSLKSIICLVKYQNNSDVLNSAHYNTLGRYGCFFLADGLNSSEISSFTLALKTLYETLTGLTIP